MIFSSTEGDHPMPGGVNTDPAQGVNPVAREIIRQQGARQQRQKVIGQLESISAEPNETILRERLAALIQELNR